LFIANNSPCPTPVFRINTKHFREHKDRQHFTLLEKLPAFYHQAKNRDGLLKVIGKLKGGR